MLVDKQQENQKKIAIYGGTFDPIHRAHVSLADYAVNCLKLDELYFMPAYVSPFKQDKKISSGEDRAAMISAILSYNPAFRVSNYEIMRETPSYTSETLKHFLETLDAELHFVLGLDSIVELQSWHNGEEILRTYPLITTPRPGTDYKEALETIVELEKKYDAVIYVLDMPPMNISATEIRNRVKNGLAFDDLVLPEVEEYILEHNLYK